MDEMHRRVLVFAKVPEKGRVKTRLEKDLDQDVVLKLYKMFVEDILGTLEKANHDTVISFWPPDREADMQNWLGNSLDFLPQTGADLGQRMRNAFERVFAESTQQAILIGTDIPDLDTAVIDQAFQALSNHDMAIGPAQDGGYYLIGFNRDTFCKDVFEGVSWGSGQVFEETMQKARQLSLRVHTLPVWLDIDTPADLQLFYRRAVKKEMKNTKTFRYLHQFFANE